MEQLSQFNSYSEFAIYYQNLFNGKNYINSSDYQIILKNYIKIVPSVYRYCFNCKSYNTFFTEKQLFLYCNNCKIKES